MTTTLSAPSAAPPAAPAGTNAAPAVRPWTPCLRRVRYEPEPGRPEPPPALPAPPPAVPGTPPADREAVRAALAGALRLAMEVLDGRRPPHQLAHRFAPSALRYWRTATQQRAARRHGVAAPARVLRLVVCLPRAGAAEAAAVCEIDGRVRALAARFETAELAGPWRCTALRLC